MNNAIWAENYSNFDTFYNNDLPTMADNYILQLKNAIETEYSDAMIVYTLKTTLSADTLRH